MSELDATNYNRNYLLWGDASLLGQPFGRACHDAGYHAATRLRLATTRCDGADFTPRRRATLYGVYDQISRPDEKATANYGSFEAEYRVTDALTLTGQIGTSEGHGETPTQDVSETHPAAGSGASWQLHGLGSAPNFAFGATDNSTPFPNGTPVAFGWIFGAQLVDVEDEEDWAKIDADFAVDSGAWTDLQFGARYNEHKRESKEAIAQGPTFSGGTTGVRRRDPANYPTTSELSVRLQHVRRHIPDEHLVLVAESQLAEYNGGGNYVQRDPLARAFYQYLFEVEEKNAAGYVQANFKGSNWSGNIGLRYVQTEEDITHVHADGAPTTRTRSRTSLFGPFKRIAVDNTYNDWLPSANLKWQFSDDLVARFAVGKTMTRADYSALGGSTNLLPPANVGGTGTATGGNPDLEPIRSTNYDAGLEWYFAEGSLLSATLFYMDLDNYVGFGSETRRT